MHGRAILESDGFVRQPVLGVDPPMGGVELGERASAVADVKAGDSIVTGTWCDTRGSASRWRDHEAVATFQLVMASALN
jgi:hypothetical protein